MNKFDWALVYCAIGWTILMLLLAGVLKYLSRKK